MAVVVQRLECAVVVSDVHEGLFLPNSERAREFRKTRVQLPPSAYSGGEPRFNRTSLREINAKLSSGLESFPPSASSKKGGPGVSQGLLPLPVPQR